MAHIPQRDPYACEQDALLREYYLAKQHRDTDNPWSADGPNSISPFVPCAAARIPFVLRAARLGASDVLWDLGCGDGRLLHQAATQYGCRCVGVDIDAPCIEEAKQRAVEQQVGTLCNFATCDLTKLEPGTLRPSAISDSNEGVDLGTAALDACEHLPAPTCVLLFVTSHGLSRLQEFLYGEWAAGGLRIITCVESLASCFDFESEDPLFGSDESRHDWPIYEYHSAHGVFVTPPLHTSVEEWALDEPQHEPCHPPTPAQLDARAIDEPGANFEVIGSILSPDDIDTVEAFGAKCMAAEAEAANVGEDGEGSVGMSAFNLFEDGATESDLLSSAEDALHSCAEHRVVHMHRHGAFQAELPRLLDRILARVRYADAQRWKLLVGRQVHIRSIEWHRYLPGGAVNAEDHRDNGSLLTLSVLLTPPENYAGAKLCFPRSVGEIAETEAFPSPQLGHGDGVIFPSETRHNVSALISGERHSLVVELWEGAPNTHNRHR